MSFEPLQINDKTFLINTLIQRAPRKTVIRELFKNAEESARNASQKKEIRIYPTYSEGSNIPKLTFWNTGSGMDYHELKLATEISSSLNKSMGLEENFGIGAKVSGLAVSPLGMTYRSCKNSQVHEVTIGFDENSQQYGRLPMQLSDGSIDTVIDITEAYAPSELEFDWTEVVLQGASEAHNTIEEPLMEGTKEERAFVASEIFRRFAAFENDIEIQIDTAMTKGGVKSRAGGSFRKLKSLESILPKLPKHETVLDEETGTIVRFIHDPKHPSSSHTISAREIPAVSSTTFCALVHKNERYDYKTKTSWAAAAPKFGIPFGSRVISIEIFVPESSVRPSQYRDSLQDQGDGSPVAAEHYASIVRNLRPEWVEEIIQQEAPTADTDLDDIQNDLQRILDEFRVPVNAHRLDKSSDKTRVESSDNGTPEASAVDETISPWLAGLNQGSKKRKSNGNKANDNSIRQAPSGAKPSRALMALERAPKLHLLTEPFEIDEKGISGKAAVYYKDSQEIFVNCLYPSSEKMFHELFVEFENLDDDEKVRSIVLESCRRSLAFRVGKGVVFAISKRLVDEWTTDDLDRATSPEALSLLGEDYKQSLVETRRQIRTQIKRLQAEGLKPNVSVLVDA